MADVVSLRGESVPEAKSTPLEVLRATIAEIEDGLPVEQLMILLEVTGSPDPSMVKREVRDTGVAASEAVFWLEMHKVEIVAAMCGLI